MHKRVNKYTMKRNPSQPNVKDDGISRAMEGVRNFYDDYIFPNRITLIFFTFTAVLLYYRYNMEEEEREQFDTDYLNENKQATMNPSKPPSRQVNHANYPPKPIPVNHNGSVDTSYRRRALNPPKEMLTVPNQIPDLQNRSCYRNIMPQTSLVQYPEMAHPFGWETNFNSVDDSFYQRMMMMNNNNMASYQQLYENTVNGLKTGPDFLDDIPEIVPPFAN